MNGHNLLSKKGRTLVSAYKERNSHDNGWCFQADSVESLRNSIMQILSLPIEEIKRYAHNAYVYVNENFNYAQTANQYIEIIERECDK